MIKTLLCLQIFIELYGHFAWKSKTNETEGWKFHTGSFVLDFHAKWPYNSINICKQSNVFIIVYSKHFSFASPSSLANIIWRTLFSSIKSQFLTLFSSKYETSNTQFNICQPIKCCKVHHAPRKLKCIILLVEWE